MPRIPGGAFTRAVIGAATVATTVLAATAVPAGATSRAGDPLADVARQTLDDLHAAQLHRLAAAAGTEDPSVSAGADATYHNDLTMVAAFVAPHTASAPDAFVSAWEGAGETRTSVVLAALAELGVPYRHNSSRPGAGFDCSGLTMYAWGQAGVALPHQDGAQIAMTQSRTWESAAAGDLVDYPGHVMLYVGAGHAIIDAPHSGMSVRVTEFSGRRGVRLGSPIG